MTRKSTRCKCIVLGQLCKLIPPGLVNDLAKKYGVDKRARKFTPWSHVTAMLYTHLAHSLSLNDVCDSLLLHSDRLQTIRGAVPPAKNTLSHANSVRDSAMAKALFYETLDHLRRSFKGFGGRRGDAMPRRFTRAIHVLDSTTVRLVANCMDWASHRRRKAAAKLHLSLDLQSFLPGFAVIDTARHHDNSHAATLCSLLKRGEIAVFDKGYNDYEFLHGLTSRGIFWVTRPKDNLKYKRVEKLLAKRKDNILSDELIELCDASTKKKYPEPIRLVRAKVEVDGEMREMSFITNNREWQPSSVCDLYKSRWEIEVFFKEIKQSLQLCDFLGHNQNAIEWQIWTALLLYVLMRFHAYLNTWQHGFKRLVCMLRCSLWEHNWIENIMDTCGTAGGRKRMLATPQGAYLPGFP